MYRAICRDDEQVEQRPELSMRRRPRTTAPLPSIPHARSHALATRVRWGGTRGSHTRHTDAPPLITPFPTLPRSRLGGCGWWSASVALLPLASATRRVCVCATRYRCRCAPSHATTVQRAAASASQAEGWAIPPCRCAFGSCPTSPQPVEARGRQQYSITHGVDQNHTYCKPLCTARSRWTRSEGDF